MGEKKKDWEKGYIHVYTGNGKGKTTAALGLALRATGAGMKSYFGQFMKGRHYSELDSVREHLPGITIEQYGQPDFCVPGKVSPDDLRLAAEGFRKAKGALDSGEFDIVVLDEINTALYFKLLEVNDVLGLMRSKPPAVELVLTGRYAPEEVIDAADLVTEMKEIKHYFEAGVDSRAGIES